MRKTYILPKGFIESIFSVGLINIKFLTVKRVLLKVFSYLAFCTLTVLVSVEEVANDPYAKLASKIKPSVVTISSIDRGEDHGELAQALLLGQMESSPLISMLLENAENFLLN